MYAQPALCLCRCGKCAADSKAQHTCINSWVVQQQIEQKEKSCLLVLGKDKKQACVNAWALRVNGAMTVGAYSNYGRR